jgi:hypothetical protein
MPVAPVLYSDTPEATPRILTEEEKAALAQDQVIQDLKRAAAGVAKFKIELMFTAQFSIIKPVQGVVSFWESGSKLHGGGDTIIHFCPGKRLGKNQCEHYIPDPSHGYGFLVCPACNNLWNGDQVYGQVLARLTAQDWAKLLEKYYRKLDMNCDIVIKYQREDIRNAHRHRLQVDKLADVRSAPKRLRRIYTLQSLMADMAGGSSLYDRILSFVKA